MVCNALISALLGVALGAICATTGQAQSAAAPSRTRIAIGAHMPMTGPLARTGRSLDEGLRVGFDACNAAQTRYHFELDAIDDESTPAKAVSAVEKLAASGVTAIIASTKEAPMLLAEGRLVFRDMSVEENLCLGAHPRRGRPRLAANLEHLHDLYFARRAGRPERERGVTAPPDYR